MVHILHSPKKIISSEDACPMCGWHIAWTVEKEPRILRAWWVRCEKCNGVYCCQIPVGVKI